MNTAKILEKIVDTDFYKSLIQEDYNQTIEEREQVAAFIKETVKDHRETEKDFEEKIQKKQKEWVAAARKEKKLRIELGKLRKSSMGEETTSNKKIASFEKSLRETADPRISEALDLFNRQRYPLRSKEVTLKTYDKKYLWGMGKYEVKYCSNAPTIAEALRYTLDGIHTLRDMELEPVLDEDKLENLISGLKERMKAAGVEIKRAPDFKPLTIKALVE